MIRSGSGRLADQGRERWDARPPGSAARVCPPFGTRPTRQGRLGHVVALSPRTHVLLLIQDLHIRVIAADTGGLLRDLVLDPTRNYQPQDPPTKRNRLNPEVRSVADALRHPQAPRQDSNVLTSLRRPVPTLTPGFLSTLPSSIQRLEPLWLL